ncbi:DUF2795 domain-containing protein [Rubrobacter taiwanensis]|jgi:hypothetical protein|nr:DUF2795 domain-containing protein [Rubrobacter taiwanensis]
MSWEELEPYVEEAFAGTAELAVTVAPEEAGVSRDDLLFAARENDAPDEVLELLEQIGPKETFADPEDLREYLLGEGLIEE